MSTNSILSLHISDLSYSESAERILDLARNRKSSYICFANVHMSIEAYENPNFARMVNAAKLVCADGMTLVKAVKFKHRKEIERVAGMDMMPTLINKCEEQGISLFFLGSTDEILGLIRKRVEKENPNLKVAGYFSPPFKKLTEKEKAAHRELINNSGAQMVFVALGCPKQEKWMAENSPELNAVLLGVGAAFPIYARAQKRAPEWLRNMSLEWVFRLMQDPQRLFKRYFYTNSKFVFLFLKELFK